MITQGATAIEQPPVRLSKFEIVKYQLIHYCFMKKVKINDTELDILSYLGELGKIRMSVFCEKAAKKGLLGTHQAVNTCLGKLLRSDLYVKEGVGKKKIYLNPKLKIYAEGNIVITIKLIKVEPNYVPGAVQKNSKEAQLA